ncbi:hypothetical protein [Streptomyces sp. B6B3]|uniref:hypothetical protein n=1 Tax=Streptomyces sp. B6B3 TaxID=3153570 RepID=UPI00325E2676
MTRSGIRALLCLSLTGLLAPVLGAPPAAAQPGTQPLSSVSALGAEVEPWDSGPQEPRAEHETLSEWEQELAALAYPGAGEPAPASDYALTAGSDLSGRIADLAASLPDQEVVDLLGQANRELRTGSSCPDPFGEGDGGLPPVTPSDVYCFEEDDSVTTEWIPQAVTGVSDAEEDEVLGSDREPVLVSWYDSQNPGRENGCTSSENDSCNEKGVRVSFVDPDTGEYRHVLLVWPYYNSYDHISFDAVHASENPMQDGIHAGGMAWYGNYLFVADTLDGIRVFDMRYVLDLNPDQNADVNDPTPDGLTSDVTDLRQVGRQSNVWYSYGYRYVMPQVATWTYSATQYNDGEGPCADVGAPKASYLSIDRSGDDQLVVGEYCTPTSDLPSAGRVGAWPLSGLTGSGSTVSADPASTYFTPTYQLQGVARYDGAYYFNQSHLYSNGSLWRGAVVDGALSITGPELRTAVGPEDLYYERGAASGLPRLWSVSEHRENISDPSCSTSDNTPCGRVLYAHAVSDLAALLGARDTT